jgi:hypothetical protein
MHGRRGPDLLLTAVLLSLCGGVGGGLVACVPGPGPFHLAAARGVVRDRDSGAPVQGALVLQWYHGAGRMGGPRPEYHARATRSDASGRFAFERALAPSLRMWLLRTYGPEYAFHHPRYGLVRGARETADGLVLEGSTREEPLRASDLEPFCRGERSGEAARLLREACPPHPARPPRPGSPEADD